MRFVMLGVLLTSTVAAANPIKLEIKPATLTWKPKQPVLVTLEVTNTSAKPITLKVMSCSFMDQFARSDPELTWDPQPCDKNALGHYELGPARSRTWSVAMLASATAKPGKHPLTMSFTHDGKSFKSNQVTITVAP